TITQAIALAGGFTQWANKDKILLIRKSPMNPEGNRVTIKYSDIVSGTNMKANILLKAGDTVIVP
ncbi:MAG: SLBB domain-containing protein, partial [Nitrospirota bacterium]